MNRFTAVLILFSTFLAASTGWSAPTDLRQSLKDSVGDHWIYDDFKQAQARAQETGKPLLVLFRCVP